MKWLMLIAVVLLAVQFVACDSSYDADNYAETLIDLELDGEYGVGESNKALSVERMGFELSDYYAYELELAEDMTLARKVNEELIALAPAPGDIADFYYELLNGEENTPVEELTTSPEYVNDVLSKLENGAGYFSFYLDAREGLDLKSRVNIQEDEIIDYLDDYGITPRSIAAMSLLSGRGFGFAGEPIEEYNVDVVFELVKPLSVTVSLEKYVELHSSALIQILEESATPEAAYKHGLEQAGLSKEDVDAQNALLNEWSMIQQAVMGKIAWELKEITEDFEDKNDMTFHLAQNVLEMAEQYYDESESDKELESFYGTACSTYGLPENALDDWLKMTENYYAYLDGIGKLSGELNDDTYVDIFCETYIMEDESEVAGVLEGYNTTPEAFEAYTEDLFSDTDRLTAVTEAITEKDPFAGMAFGLVAAFGGMDDEWADWGEDMEDWDDFGTLDAEVEAALDAAEAALEEATEAVEAAE